MYYLVQGHIIGWCETKEVIVNYVMCDRDLITLLMYVITSILHTCAIYIRNIVTCTVYTARSLSAARKTLKCII